MALTIIILLIQFISRHWISRQTFGLDDGLCLVAAASAISFIWNSWHSTDTSKAGSTVHSALLFANVELGYGQYMYNIQLMSLTPSRFLQIAVAETVYILIVYFVELSLLAEFCLFRGSKALRIPIYVGIAFCTTITTPFFGVAIIRNVRCHGPNGRTEDISHSTSLTTVIFRSVNVLSDFYIFFIPMRQLKGLTVDRKRRICLIALIMVGFVACAMTVIRFRFLASEYEMKERLYSIALVSHFTTVEINLAIVCSCMIFCPVLIKTSKANAESAVRFFLSRTCRCWSEERSLKNYEAPPLPLAHAADWERFQAPATFEAEL